jgi:bifunctional enzyme CysN/CysC
MSDMNVVIVGHVDHGKSTIIGRLMADTHSLPQGKIESIREKCKRQSKVFEYAYLLDALKDEQSQGITIDTARCFFKTEKRNYLIMDAPGHVEFLKNMVTGASSADIALLVIDAVEGVQENSKRHGYLLSLLGVKQIIVLINKMDLVEYSQNVFDSIVKEYGGYLSNIEVTPITYIPVSGAMGDNIVKTSENMPWYLGMNILNIMDSLGEPTGPLSKPFRMPVQDIYKFTANNDSRRIIAGTVLTGRVKCDDAVCFYPSKKQSTIKTIESYNRHSDYAEAGYTCGFTLHDEIYVRRGELAFLERETPPICSDSLLVKMFWLGTRPLITGGKYILKIGHEKVAVAISEIKKTIDANSLCEQTNENKLLKNHIGECILKLERPVAFDVNIWEMAKFVLVDEYEICGGGYILSIFDEFDRMNNIFVTFGQITNTDRTRRLKQKGLVVWLYGRSGAGKTTIAVQTEKIIFEQGFVVYRIDGDDVRANLCSDLGFSEIDRNENIRRIAEISRMFCELGVITLVCTISPYEKTREIAREIIGKTNLVEVYINASTKCCAKRDPKSLYKKAETGRVENFSNLQFEEPQNPDLIINTEKMSVSESISALYSYLIQNIRRI